MKKLLVFLLALVLSVGLLGCAETDSENTQPTHTESHNTKATETESVITTEATESTMATEATETTETTEATEVTSATESSQNPTDDGQVTMVWIPTKGGTKYHSKESCSGMDEPRYIAKSQAEQEGFTACKKCYK